MSHFNRIGIRYSAFCRAFFCALFVAVLSVAIFSNAFTVPLLASSDSIYDRAGLLNSEQIESLQAQLGEVESKYNISVYILTDEDSGGLSRKRYMEDFADENSVGDAALIFVNMEPDNRGVEIQGYGTCEYYISNSRIEYILDEVAPRLSDGDYYGAFQNFLNEVDYYCNLEMEKDSSTNVPSSNYGESDNYYNGGDSSNTEKNNSNTKNNNSYAESDKYYSDEKDSSIFKNIFLQIGVSFLVGFIVVLSMAHVSQGKVTVNKNTYLDFGNSGITHRRDDYVRTTVTRVKKPEQNNNDHSSGGGGGGISSGGSSHSGGGRSF